MATIYCFTSTGNSLYAARRIAEEIGAKILPMNGDSGTCVNIVLVVYIAVPFRR